MTDTKAEKAEAAKAAETQKYVTQATIYKGNGEYIKPKTIVELTDEQAERLGDVVELVVEEKPKKSKKDEK